MTETTRAAVLYAAKSTDDPNGSIPGQLKDCRNLAAEKGLEIVGEFKDKAKSAYHGDRGPDLAAALAECERVVSEHGSCSLVVQHSDRLARGDAKTAKHLVEYTLWALKTGVTIRSVQDPEMFPEGDYGLLMGAIGGMRNHQDSKRKANTIRDGLQRRLKERGKPIGAVPLGHRVEKTVVDGKVVTNRVIDPATRPIPEQAFDGIEASATAGAVARQLNADGHRTRRGKQFTARTVRELIRTPAYKGEGCYDPIIDPDRWQRINDKLGRTDPAAIQRRKGGRPTKDDFLLRGLVFCAACGLSMYSVHRNGKRGYQCSAVKESRGTCDARLIPADLIERHVLDHLSWFVGGVEDWLQGKVSERGVERQARQGELDRQRARLHALDRKRESHLAEYDRMVDDGDRLARLALERVDGIDRDREDQAQKILEAEAVLSEWTGPPDVSAALDYYNQVVALVEGKVKSADGAQAMNAALHDVLAGIWASLDDGHLHAEFQLRALDDPTASNGLAQVLSASLGNKRMTLGPRIVDGNPDPDALVRDGLAKPDASDW